MVSPAAARCPPKRMKCPAQRVSAACRSKRGMERPEPFPIPASSTVTITAGRAVCSTMRAAAIPMTPWCHPVPEST